MMIDKSIMYLFVTTLLVLCVYNFIIRDRGNGVYGDVRAYSEYGSRKLATTTPSVSEHAQLKQRKKLQRQSYVPYTDEENVVRKALVKWDDFVALGVQMARTKPSMRMSTLRSLQQCTVEPSPQCKEVAQA